MAAMRSLGLDAVREIELSENIDASERVVFLDAGALDEATLARLADTDGLTGLGSAWGAFGSPYVTDTLAIGETLADAAPPRAGVLPGQPLSAAAISSPTSRAGCPRAARCSICTPASGCSRVAAAVARGASVVAVEGDRFAAADLAGERRRVRRRDHHGARVGRRHRPGRSRVRRAAAVSMPVDRRSAADRACRARRWTTR